MSMVHLRNLRLHNQGSIVSLDSLTEKVADLQFRFLAVWLWIKVIWQQWMKEASLSLIILVMEILPWTLSIHEYQSGSTLLLWLLVRSTTQLMEHFDGFKILSSKNRENQSNYSAAELDKLYSMMNLQDSPLAGKATFKELRNATVSMPFTWWHIALLKVRGDVVKLPEIRTTSGIAAYDTYLSAKSFDNVDKGILGAAKWIRENYIDYGRDHLGNKATGWMFAMLLILTGVRR